MKLPIIIAMSFVAILSVVMFNLWNLSYDDYNATYNIAKKKKAFSILCSPQYIPGVNNEMMPLEGWGTYSWQITTTSDSAQYYFNQGINMYYGFHIVESRASFEKAITFDPDCAMAWWGKALALGPNINDFVYQAPIDAYPSAIKAKQLISQVSPLEQALISAMAIRYSSDSTGDQTKMNGMYKENMSMVYKQYMNNADVASIYADALLLLHPWDLYDYKSQPKPWTLEIVKTVQHALKINPNHPGANHYYIHSVEGSSHPADAMKSAELLALLMPGVAHIVHMPSHIFIRTGYYAKGMTVNDDAVEAYSSYLQAYPDVEQGMALYSLHAMHMKANCAQMAGNYDQAMAASKALKAAIPVEYLGLPGSMGNYVQYMYHTMLFTQIRFGKWDELLNASVTDTLVYAPVLQHFARGLALSRKGDAFSAKRELQLMQEKMKNPDLKAVWATFSPAYNDALVGEHLLNGAIAECEHKLPLAIAYYKKAVAAEDSIVYNEPRDWLLPARQYLGSALLKAKKQMEAEAVFKKDLVINPNNGWSLTGLKKIYQSTKNVQALKALNHRLRDAWLVKDTKVNNPVF